LKHAALLNTYILSCVDGYYVINLIHNGMPNLKINQYILLNSLQSSEGRKNGLKSTSYNDATTHTDSYLNVFQSN